MGSNKKILFQFSLIDLDNNMATAQVGSANLNATVGETAGSPLNQRILVMDENTAEIEELAGLRFNVEKPLLEIINSIMTDVEGPDWYNYVLKDVIRENRIERWQKIQETYPESRFVDALDWSDYPDIMGGKRKQYFVLVFADDFEVLLPLLKSAGQNARRPECHSRPQQIDIEQARNEYYLLLRFIAAAQKRMSKSNDN